MAIHPTREQIERLSTSTHAGPVVMLNLLRFVPDGGRASYVHYGEGMQSILHKAGGKVLWYGRADSVVIGDDDRDAWDAVILVWYPSRQAFLDMVLDPEYRSVGERRTSALVDSRLIACTELYPSGE